MTVNEYAYLCHFLYPYYMEPVYKENLKFNAYWSEERQAEHEQAIETLINDRANKLFTRSFRGLLQECLYNLYIHATSREDLMRNVEDRREEE